jgi:hypothetical protein
MAQRHSATRAAWRGCCALACTALAAAQPALAGATRAHGAPAGIVIVPVCDGDCDGDGRVSIAELVTGVNIAQGQLAAGACPAFDADGDGAVAIAELIAAVRGALADCAAVADPISLSAAALAPGEMLTVFHSSIGADEPVEVTFQGAGRYRLRVRTALTEAGAAHVAVPPFVDPASGRFSAGEVAVSIAGVDDAAPFLIEALPEVGGAPGAATAAVLGGTLDSLGAALAGLAALRSETGLEHPPLARALVEHSDVVATLADEAAGGALTLGTPTGPVVVDGTWLALLDRLLAAPYLGYARQYPAGADVGRAADIPTAEEIAVLVDHVRRQGIAGMQVLGSYVSVLTGVVGLVAGAVPGGQPLAGVAAAMAVASTGVVTLGSALVSIVADVGIDAVRGEVPDLYRAVRNAQDTVVSGLRSIGLTFASAIEWAGQELVNLVSFANDTRDGVISLRDAQCANEPPERRRTAPRLVFQDFCRLTGETTTPTAIPTATLRLPASATPTRVPAATPSRTATAPRHTATPTRTASAAPRTATPRPSATRPPATATRTAVPSPTPSAPRTATSTPTTTRTRTATRTPAEGAFTVIFYRNLDGATGSGAAGAQVRLSGAADFPTIAWTTAVGSAQQVTVGRNGGGLLYGIAATGDGEPVPIRAPVRYGDYGIPDTVGIVAGPAPALQTGTEYAAVVTPFVFQGGTAAIVFRVGR